MSNLRRSTICGKVKDIRQTQAKWPTAHSKQVTTYASEWWCNSKTKRSKFKVTRNENAKKRYSRTFHQKWIDLITSNQDRNNHQRCRPNNNPISSDQIHKRFVP